MRYRVGEDPAFASAVSTEGVLVFTAVLGLIIGIILVWLAGRGRQMWLLIWSWGLILASLAYLAWDFFGPG